MAIGIYIPRIDTRSVYSCNPAQSVQGRIADEGLASCPEGVEVQLQSKVNKAGYNYYSAFVRIRDDYWGKPEDVTHILRMVHSESGYRLYTNSRGHHWLLLPNRRDVAEHAALAREQVAFEMDLIPPPTRFVSAANSIGAWYKQILSRRQENIRIGDFLKARTDKAVQLQPPCTKGDMRGIC